MPVSTLPSLDAQVDRLVTLGWPVLELQRVLVGSGMAVSTVPQLALALSASEARAGQLLAEAEALVVLPGAIEAVEAGLLTIEQSHTVIDQLKV